MAESKATLSFAPGNHIVFAKLHYAIIEPLLVSQGSRHGPLTKRSIYSYRKSVV